MIIKNFKLFKESLLTKLEGPTEEEIWDNLNHLSPDMLLDKSIKIDFLKGIKYAIDNGATLEKDDIITAISNRSYNTIKYLLSTDINFEIDKKIINFYGLQLIEEERLDIIKLLEKYIKEILKHDDYLLTHSLALNKIDIFKYFLSLEAAYIHISNDFLLRKYGENLDYNRTKLLLELGANVNIFGGYLLDKAAINLSVKMVQLFMDYGIKFKDYDELIKVLNERLKFYKYNNRKEQVELSKKIIEMLDGYNKKLQSI